VTGRAPTSTVAPDPPSRSEANNHPMTKSVMSSDQALRGFKAAIDAALGRGSQALTEWIEDFK
jgi:hypothetical protein